MPYYVISLLRSIRTAQTDFLLHYYIISLTQGGANNWITHTINAFIGRVVTAVLYVCTHIMMTMCYFCK